MSAKKSCKGCGSTTRPTPHPGPRCATCNRAVRKGRRDAAWEKRLWETYHLTPDQYWAIYEAQGGKCVVCRRATGATKRLAVDHDHLCCKGPTSCGKCVRGLLCSIDNKWIGHIRDDPEAADRAAGYLRNPPAQDVLAK